MYNIIYETSRQSRFNAQCWMLGAGALGRPGGMVGGGRRVEGSGGGTHVCLWWIHFDIWQNQYNIVKFKNKIKKREREREAMNYNPDFQVLKSTSFGVREHRCREINLGNHDCQLPKIKLKKREHLCCCYFFFNNSKSII